VAWPSRVVVVAGAATTAGLVPFAVAGDVEHLIHNPWLITLDVAVGVVFSLAALISSTTRVERLLMWSVGLAWLVGSILPGAGTVHQGLLAIALLGYPSGRIKGLPGWIIAGLAAAAAFGALDQVGVAALFGATAAYVVVRRPIGQAGRRYPAAAAAAVALVLLGEWVAARLFIAGFDPDVATLFYDLTLVAVGASFAPATRADAADRIRLADRLLRQEAAGLDGLSAALAHSLADPSVAILAWDTAAAPTADTEQRWLRIEDDQGRPAAIVRHSSDALIDPQAASSVTTAVRLVLTRMRLQQEQDDLVRLQARTQARLVAASDRQREQIAAELKQRVEDRLHRAGSALASVRSDLRDGDASAALDVVAQELDSAIREIAALVWAVPQAELGGGKLDGALQSLALTSPIPVEVTVTTAAGRAAETALFYVCSEALANAIKHAGANRVRIDIHRWEGAIRATVADDGRGGADPFGSGLQGLADRLATIGGRLRIESPPGAGTTVVAAIPAAPVEVVVAPAEDPLPH
jgi:signal transduction histidine kinase